jgi:hypothetical protein
MFIGRTDRGFLKNDVELQIFGWSNDLGNTHIMFDGGLYDAFVIGGFSTLYCWNL